MKIPRAENSLVIEVNRSLHHGVVKTPRFIGHSAVFWANFTPELVNREGLMKTYVKMDGIKITQAEEILKILKEVDQQKTVERIVQSIHLSNTNQCCNYGFFKSGD